MEGISHEAASLAGHLKLDHLVCIFDDNGITIDGSTGLACSDDVIGRFTAYGWHVIDAGEIGEDPDALEAVLIRAREHRGSPTLVRLKTHIGYPSPDFTDRHEAHGNPFDADATRRTKEVLGIPDEPFWAPEEVVTELRRHAATRDAELRRGYTEPEDDEYRAMIARPDVEQLRRAVSSLTHEKDLATRQSITLAVSASLPLAPGLIAGSADLTGNTGVKIPGFEAFTPNRPQGRQLYYGIREHAMGAIMVGIALHGILVPMGGTFFVFADYMKPAIRLAALSRAKVIFVFSHDSVGVGEDGPTHQPVEQLASLRSIPGLRVIRPADSRETAEAWIAALAHDGPSALILSRQTVPNVTDGTAVPVGAKVVRESSAPLVTLVGTGSELSIALRAAEVLESEGVGSRVVSMPSWDMFAQSPTDHQTSTLGQLPVVSVEAASTFGWERYADAAIGIDRFGASAPGSVVMDSLGINVDRVVAEAKRLTGAA
jgi:transketolase